MSALKAGTPDRLAFSSEYLDLGMFERAEVFERELVAYLAAKYAHTKLDMVVLTSSEALRFTMRHRAQLFPGVPIVFVSVIGRAVADVAMGTDVSGIWLTIDWAGTLAVARRLQPDIERAVIVTGASPVDRLWAAEARAQFARMEHPISLTYLEDTTLETVLEHLRKLPPRTVVLLGAFLGDPSGRRFMPQDTTPLISAASSVPVYGTSENHLGHGAVGGHVISFELQGKRGAELAARVLRRERPPVFQGETLTYRFDARQLRRWGLDERRLPVGTTMDFNEPTVWEAYGAYIVAGVAIVAVQTWTIFVLLANRAQRRRVQQELAARLRFETLMSDLLAGQLTSPAAGIDAEVRRALAMIGTDLDVDRVVLGERDAGQQSIRITHAWTREGVTEIPASVMESNFPWTAQRLVEGHVIVVSPLRPLPPEAVTDRQAMLARGTRSLLAVPLVVEGKVVGVLGCGAVRGEREWPDVLVERLRFLAEVFASRLARRRAELAARASEERFLQQRQELAHALRVNTLGELGASLAHEINQPLSAILINARTASSLLARHAGDDATIAEALADIAADAKRAGDIIDRLRALSRKEHAAEQGLRVDALVDEVAGLLHQDFVRRGIGIKRITAPGLPTVTGDRIQLQQIFLNVLVNASEALEGTDREHRDITIVTSRLGSGLVEVAVRDTGPGGKMVDVERIFDRFVTTKPGGLGMGLAISRSIALAHGGRIYARTNPDRGLTVIVELPAERAAA